MTPGFHVEGGDKVSPCALLLHSIKIYSPQTAGLTDQPCPEPGGGLSEKKLWLVKGIVGRLPQPCSQGRVTEPDIPNGFPRPDTWVLPGRGTLGRIGMGPSAAVTHPVISWTFIHFLLNYVLFKMVFCGFLPGSFQITPSWCPR